MLIVAPLPPRSPITRTPQRTAVALLRLLTVYSRIWGSQEKNSKIIQISQISAEDGRRYLKPQGSVARLGGTEGGKKATDAF